MSSRPPTAPLRSSRRRASFATALLLASLACGALFPDRLAAQDRDRRDRDTRERDRDAREEDEDNPRLRWEYLMQQRAWPRGEVPAGALQAAKAQYRRQWPGDLLKRKARGLAPSFVSPSGVAPTGASLVGAGSASAFATAQWTALGPSPIPGFNTADAGRIATIAVHPTNRQTLYVGGAQGGVWKSTDGGASWLPLTDGECSLAMGSLAIDPVDPQIVYAGTGEMNFSADSYYGCGVLRSTDGGATWSRLGANVWDAPNGGATIAKVLVDRASAGTTGALLNVASSTGVWRSTDGGATWALTLAGAATDLVADPTANGAVLFAAVGFAFADGRNGIYRSADRGATWTRLAGGLPTSDMGRIALAHGATAGTVVAAVQDAFGGGGNDGTLLGLWRTTDGGTSWSKLAATGTSCSTQCWYDLVVAIDPSNANRIWFGGVSLFRSTDGGTTFAPVGNAVVHVDHHALVFDPQDPQVVYAGSDGGIYRSPDGGASWTSLNTNLELTQFYGGVSLHPTDLSRVLGGTQDNGTLEYQGSARWPRVLGGDGGFTAIHPLGPDTAWAETQWQANGGFSGPRRRTTATGGFALMMNGIDAGDRALFIPPLVLDAARPSRVLFGTARLYQTTNSGEQWTAISPDLSRGSGAISAIATAPTDAGTIYVGTNDGLLRVTANGGATWATAGGLPNRYVEHIVVDPANARRAWVAFSGFDVGHVWLTTDGGASWTNVSGNLPNMPVNALAFVPATGALYAGTDLGMFATTDAAAAGATWTPFNEGFPNVAVFSLAFQERTGTLVAGTHGRGAFARALEGVAIVVTIAPAAPTTMIVGDTLALSATATEAGGAPMPTTFIWSSSNPDIVSVDASGRVVARGLGTATVTARSAEGATASRAITTRPLAVMASADSVRFASLTDTARVGVSIVARDGSPIAGAIAEWVIADPTVASVAPASPAVTALVRALRNGTTLAIARAGGLADTITVRVRQVAATVVLPTLPDTLFAGEVRTLDVIARDALGQAIADAAPTITSSAPGVATVDAATRRLVAVGPGELTLRATMDGATASRTLTVVAPSTLVVTATPLVAGEPAARSMRGTVLTLLRLTLRVDGREPVELDTLGFDVTGRDQGAVVQLVADADRDGVLDANETMPMATSAPAILTGGTTRVRIRAIGTLPGSDSLALFVQVVLAGGAPHGSDVALALVPAETRTTTGRSRRADLLAQPVQPVEGTRRTTVLAAEEALALSENPVRGDRVIMSFRETPRTAAIYTLTGRRVTDLRRRLAGGVRVEWDLTNDQGGAVAPGVYLVIFDVGGQVVRQKLFVTRGTTGREE